MMKMKILFFFLQFFFNCILMTSQSDMSNTQETYLDLEKQFLMKWSYNVSHIIFELRVNTTGWIGIGFSSDGNMVNADIHLGWVDSGIAHITDRHGLDHNGYPPLDDEQNVELLEGWECDGVTFLKFARQLAACEEKQDLPVTTDTMRVIYAYDDNDPDKDGNFNKHTSEHRGSKFLLVLQPPAVTEIKETDLLTYDFRSNSDAIPVQVTYYKCTLLKLPDLPTKHHVIKREPIIDEQYRNELHHMNVYACTDLKNSSFEGKSEECFVNQHPDFQSCFLMIYGWAVGTEAKIYPENVGYPIGGPDGFKYLKLSVHYNNPNLKEIRDSSGMRFYYSPTLRKYDAGILKVGLLPTPLQLLIPPRTASYKIDTGCDKVCLGDGMDKTHVSSINIFQAGLHAHMLGRKLKLRHIRNGTELPLIAKDNNFNFHFHEGHILSPEVVFKKGDAMQLVCDYSSAEKSQPTLGGAESTQEMCLSFIYYYPRISVSECFSAPTTGMKPLKTVMGVRSLKRINLNKPMLDVTLNDFIVTSPPEVASKNLNDVVTDYKWDKKSSDQLNEAAHRSKRLQVCIDLKSKKPSMRGPIVIKHPLKDIPEIKVCKAPSTGFPTNAQTNTCGVN